MAIRREVNHLVQALTSHKGKKKRLRKMGQQARIKGFKLFWCKHVHHLRGKRKGYTRWYNPSFGALPTQEEK